ncbi:L-rhamnose mutarotase [Terriglobus roseus]|uniref:L-rhamnose mutarotase n=1 Tax=Terriglobus roseus TaxID=392734 RepID=A0A1G7K7M1_9BACT|nr:L-rhamnose mutarotase [Terriglobus roseus]SDF33253.1 L-rhamnose mutarotase [Terriglobus roseus]
MPRYAYQLRIREGCEDEYDRRHVAVWPELLKDLADAGVHEYSIFRRDQQLFLYLHVDSFDAFLARMATSEANKRWQAMMADIFEPVPDLAPGERYAMMPEVFYMPGHPEGTE